VLDHPLNPGETGAIEKGPWHYGADYVTAYFNGSTKQLSQLLPAGFVVDPSGMCIAYVCEIVSVAEGAKDLSSSRPDRTTYREAAVGVKCSRAGKPGVFYPVMWVTTEWSLLRGLVNGYQKRLADSIHLTKLHPLNPGMEPLGPGSRLGGFCIKGPEKTLEVNVEIDSPANPSSLPSFGATFGLRRLPLTGPGQSEVDEPVEILKSNSRVTDVWVGTGTVATTLEVGDIQPISGAVYRSGFTISGSKVV